MPRMENAKNNKTALVRMCALVARYSHTGFSLVETIVAIAILSVSVVAPLSLAQRSLNASAYAKDQVTAFYLAQEAMEYIINERDSQYLLGQPVVWLPFLSCFNTFCGLDVTADYNTNPRVFTCASALSGCSLTFNPSTGIYGSRFVAQGVPDTASGWQSTSYSRMFRIITPVAANQDEADIEVVVTWNTGLLSKSFTLKSKIFNWFPN